MILAGGRGSRLGGEKATAQLAGRPLIAYPLAVDFLRRHLMGETDSRSAAAD